MVDHRDKILAMARNAPLLPAKVAKALRTNTLLASAMLSELVSKGHLKVSKFKIGSSPVYYIPELSEQLQNYIQNLNPKDRKACELLREKKVLRENILDPLTRVAIKNIKDFSRPLEVTFGGKKEIFWKWYLLPDSEAEPLIKQVLNLEAPEPEPTPPEPEPKPEPTPTPDPAPPPEPKPEPAPPPAPEPEPQPAPEPIPEVKEKPIAPLARSAAKQKKLVSRPAEKENIKKTAKVDSSDPFYKQLMKFFQKNSITVIEQTVIRKKSDYEFIIELNSAVGSLTYFCKARNKKRVSEGDLSSAFVQGQLKKLPVILLAPGELTKQAKEIAKELKGVAVKKL